MKLRINMLSNAESVKGQGVASAYQEQTSLIRELSDSFEMEINSRKSNFDIYHIHSPDLWYRLRMNKRHCNVVYVHFIPSKNDGSIKLPRLFDWVFRKYAEGMYRHADELVVVNPYFTQYLTELKIPEENISYIPNYVDSKNFHPLPKEDVEELKDKYKLPKDKFIVLGCGQIQTRKGIDDFFEVAKQNSDICFVWCGGFSFGKIMHGYKKYKKMFENLPENVVHIPIIERNMMNEIFNICDCLFMPSYIELFPMSILECANVHKPFIVRDLELYKPILFNDFCRGKDVESFSNEIRKLKDDITYYKNKSQYSKFLSEFYNKESLLTMWKEYYQRVFDKWNSKRNNKKLK